MATSEGRLSAMGDCLAEKDSQQGLLKTRLAATKAAQQVGTTERINTQAYYIATWTMRFDYLSYNNL